MKESRNSTQQKMRTGPEKLVTSETVGFKLNEIFLAYLNLLLCRSYWASIPAFSAQFPPILSKKYLN